MRVLSVSRETVLQPVKRGELQGWGVADPVRVNSMLSKALAATGDRYTEAGVDTTRGDSELCPYALSAAALDAVRAGFGPTSGRRTWADDMCARVRLRAPSILTVSDRAWPAVLAPA